MADFAAGHSIQLSYHPANSFLSYSFHALSWGRLTLLLSGWGFSRAREASLSEGETHHRAGSRIQTDSCHWSVWEWDTGPLDVASLVHWIFKRRSALHAGSFGSPSRQLQFLMLRMESNICFFPVCEYYLVLGSESIVVAEYLALLLSFWLLHPVRRSSHWLFLATPFSSCAFFWQIHIRLSQW